MPFICESFIAIAWSRLDELLHTVHFYIAQILVGPLQLHFYLALGFFFRWQHLRVLCGHEGVIRACDGEPMRIECERRLGSVGAMICLYFNKLVLGVSEAIDYAVNNTHLQEFAIWKTLIESCKVCGIIVGCVRNAGVICNTCLL